MDAAQKLTFNNLPYVYIQVHRNPYILTYYCHLARYQDTVTPV